jgi:hydroxyquinol 1,2-dioxygenase
MSGNLTEETITEEVQRTFDTSTDERFRQLFVSLVQHLHDFAREWRLTGDEWFAAIDFLERVGKISSPTRQEYVLLSDILGLSVLVDKINTDHGPSVTDSTVIGPFFVEGRPTAGNGDEVVRKHSTSPALVMNAQLSATAGASRFRPRGAGARKGDTECQQSRRSAVTPRFHSIR